MPMSDEQWIWQCDYSIPSDTREGRRIAEQVLEQLETRQWSRHDIFGVHLAMEEALVNAIMHGNHMDEDKQVHVRCRLSADRIRIEITDEGEGFDPARLPNPTDPDRLESPRGRGVMLMRTFMSRIEYSPSGNSVILEKRRDHTPEPKQ